MSQGASNKVDAERSTPSTGCDDLAVLVAEWELLGLVEEDEGSKPTVDAPVNEVDPLAKVIAELVKEERATRCPPNDGLDSSRSEDCRK